MVFPPASGHLQVLAENQVMKGTMVCLLYCFKGDKDEYRVRRNRWRAIRSATHIIHWLNLALLDRL